MRSVVILLVLMLWVPSAMATPPPEVAAWVVDEKYPLVLKIYRDYGVLLERIGDDGSTFSRSEIEAIAYGLSTLPDAWRHQGIVFVRNKKACLFGMGNDSRSCPRFDAQGRFVMYNTTVLQGTGPVERLTVLRSAERAFIQRARAAVHASASRWDSKHRWSAESAFQEIAGWGRKDRARNLDHYGFSRDLGLRSAHLDFVTFAEEYFVRPQNVMQRFRGEVDPQFDYDRSMECQDFSRQRFMSRKLAQLDPTFSLDDVLAGPTLTRCPAFEAWARVNDIESVDLLLAAATGDRPESLYGHLLIHVRYRDLPEGFEPVWQFGAVTPTNVGSLDYFLRGLLGGFYSVLEHNSWRGVDRLILQYEQRGIKRYQLDLVPTQVRQVMERIWELERRYRYGYIFFSDNCGSLVYDVFDTALEFDLPARGRFIVAPTDVLDLLASVTNPATGRALLFKRPDDLFSSREKAGIATLVRRQLRDRLRDELALSAGDATKLLLADRETESRDAQSREQAYRQLAQMLLPWLEAHPDNDLHRAAFEYFHHASVVERYFLEKAIFRARGVRLSALQEPVIKSSSDILAMRRKAFEVEDHEQRQALFGDEVRKYDRMSREGPFRAFTPAEEEVLAEEQKVRRAWRQVLDGQATLIQTLEPAFDAVTWQAEREAELRARAQNRDALALGPSGKGKVGLGFGFDMPLDQEVAWTPRLMIRTSFIEELLGDQRTRGFRPDIESVALRLDVSVPVIESFHQFLDVDLTVFRFMTIEERVGPTRKSFRDALGWMLDLSAWHHGRRSSYIGSSLQGGFLINPWQRDFHASHLVFGLIGNMRADVGPVGRRLQAGPFGVKRFQRHLYGLYANLLRWETVAGARFVLETVEFQPHVRSVLSIQHVLRLFGGYPLTFEPHFHYEWDPLVLRDDTEKLHEFRVGARFGLPF